MDYEEEEKIVLYSLPNLQFTLLHLEESKSQQVAPSDTDVLSSMPRQDQYHHKQRARGPTENTCGEKVTNRAEPANANSIIHPIRDPIELSTLGSDCGHPLVALWLSGYITVILPLCSLTLTLLKMYGDI